MYSRQCTPGRCYPDAISLQVLPGCYIPAGTPLLLYIPGYTDLFPASRCTSLLHRVLTADRQREGKRLWAQSWRSSLGRSTLAGLLVFNLFTFDGRVSLASEIVR